MVVVTTLKGVHAHRPLVLALRAYRSGYAYRRFVSAGQTDEVVSQCEAYRRNDGHVPGRPMIGRRAASRRHHHQQATVSISVRE